MADNVSGRDGSGLSISLRTSEVSTNLHVPHHRMSDGVPVTGPAAQSVINTDLLTGNVNGWYDATSFFSGAIQLLGSAGISAGAVFFEQTNDNSSTTGVPLEVVEIGILNSNPFAAAITIAANSRRIFSFPIYTRYIRIRLSVAFVGGTIQALSFFSQQPVIEPTINIQQAVAANLLATMTPVTPTLHTLVAAATVNATVVKASAGTIYGMVLSNLTSAPLFFKLYAKSSAPVVATDVPIMVFRIPSNSSFDVSIGTLGMRIATGISYVITGGATDADATTVVLAGDARVMMSYT